MRDLRHIANAVEEGLFGPNVRTHTRLWYLTSARSLHGSRPQMSLTKAIEVFSSAACEDPRDKIFGLVAIIKEDERPPVDYALTPEGVFIDACLTLSQIFLDGDDFSWDGDTEFVKALTCLETTSSILFESELWSRISQVCDAFPDNPFPDYDRRRAHEINAVIDFERYLHAHKQGLSQDRRRHSSGSDHFQTTTTHD